MSVPLWYRMRYALGADYVYPHIGRITLENIGRADIRHAIYLHKRDFKYRVVCAEGGRYSVVRGIVVFEEASLRSVRETEYISVRVSTTVIVVIVSATRTLDTVTGIQVTEIGTCVATMSKKHPDRGSRNEAFRRELSIQRVKPGHSNQLIKFRSVPLDCLFIATTNQQEKLKVGIKDECVM